MAGFQKHTGLVVPLDAANVDTDAIIPKQFLQKVNRIGFGKHLFHDWRFLDDAGEQPNPDFVMNQPRYKGAKPSKKLMRFSNMFKQTKVHRLPLIWKK